MQIVRRGDSLDATAALGAQLAGLLRPGDVVALEGELGSGKTTLVRTVVVGLGLDASIVSSPTFVIANDYPGSAEVPPVVHVDAYRLGGADELETIGWDRVLDGSAIVFVEWPSRIEGALPETHARIRIAQVGVDARRFDIDIPAAWLDRPGLLQLAQQPESREATRCPVTGSIVPGDSPTWPFADERARMADLYRWMHESYTITREMKDADLEQGE
ncbi:MAG: tRNA (adenosine(37)-N6)-threonylcarbamoyltransferase complex ATPase subunit type 1 TsaE [Planctomycetota bacterium]